VVTLLFAMTGTFGAERPAAQGVRVVDGVNVTSAREETAHALHGEEMTVGEIAGRKWRSATGWFGYSLRIYEDTPLTIVCTFADVDGDREAFDVLVDGRQVAAEIHRPQRPNPRELRLTLPLTDTAGKSQVTITFRAHPDARTARLLEVRSVQEHLE
jgi:hypothetical protein